jgi:hypothetical protein
MGALSTALAGAGRVLGYAGISKYPPSPFPEPSAALSGMIHDPSEKEINEYLVPTDWRHCRWLESILPSLCLYTWSSPLDVGQVMTKEREKIVKD